MTVFKTYLKILKKNSFFVILYTVLLIFFAGFNMQTNETNTNFIATKPDILIINNDKEIGITKNLIQYLKENTNERKIENDENAIKDALFYRDISYIISIPKNFRNDFLNGKSPVIEVKSTGNYQSSLAQMILNRYMKVAKIYQKEFKEEEKLIQAIQETLKEETTIEVTSKLNTNQLEKISFYYNFTNYSILAGCIYIIGFILASFKKETIHKRTIVSSINYKKLNRQLLISNSLFAFILWLSYVILSILLLGSEMLSNHGLLYIINSFLFTLFALTLSFLIANIIKDKNAINGIVNVVALGSSFLCGSFVPVEYLPNSVLKIARLLPSYYYIKTNEIIKELEIINGNTLQPILINMGIIILFSVFLIIITNYISKNKRKFG